MKRLLIAIFLTAVAPSLFAWGEAGHYITNDAATYGLPNDMPSFFYQAFPDLVYLAYDPDRWRSGGESLEAANAPDHFLDYEYVEGLKLPGDRYRFIALLGSSGTMRRHGIYNSTTGFLPWRIAELSERLTVLWRNWRAAPATSRERRFIERDIVTLSGILGHYVGDSAQPLHATFNYNGWVLPNPNGYTTDCDVHSRFETGFVSRALTTADIVPKLAPPVLRTDYFAPAADFIKQSNAQFDPLYRLPSKHTFTSLPPHPTPELPFSTH